MLTNIYKETPLGHNELNECAFQCDLFYCGYIISFEWYQAMYLSISFLFILLALKLAITNMVQCPPPPPPPPSPVSFLCCLPSAMLQSRKKESFWKRYNAQLIFPWTKWTPFCWRDFQNHFLEWKSSIFGLKFHWRLFPRVQLTITQHWSR